MPKNILIVEDDADVRDSLQEVLRMFGYNVQVAKNGSEALGVLQTQEPPCLIFLDLMMPVMNGWQFCFLRAQDPQLSKIPVVLITAVGNPKQKAHALGVSHGLGKPFDFGQLLAVTQSCGCC